MNKAVNVALKTAVLAVMILLLAAVIVPLAAHADDDTVTVSQVSRVPSNAELQANKSASTSLGTINLTRVPLQQVSPQSETAKESHVVRLVSLSAMAVIICGSLILLDRGTRVPATAK